MPMSFINFAVLSNIFEKYLDVDKIDIGRKMSITTEDGWETETDEKDPLYVDIPCHIESNTMDNPNLANEPTNPIITSFTVYCKNTVDIQNGDYITLKICDVNGNILDIKTGIAGEPRTYQSRIEFSVGVIKNI